MKTEITYNYRCFDAVALHYDHGWKTVSKHRELDKDKRSLHP